MSDTKILQAILDKVKAVDNKVESVDKKVDNIGGEIKGEMKNMEERLTKRMDKLGLQLARLEDDAPTIEEFEKLIRRVVKLENRVFGN